MWVIPVAITLMISTIVAPVATEYYYEWKEKKNADSRTGKKDD